MAQSIEKYWAAVDGDDIIESADTKDELVEQLSSSEQRKYDIVALPKTGRNLFV